MNRRAWLAATIVLGWSFACGADQAAPDPMVGTAEAPTTAIPRGGCVTTECHPGVKAGPFVHGPVHVDACESCHTLADASTHAFTFERDQDKTCTFCHLVEIPAGDVVHAPFAEGACLSCHDPHGGRERSLLRGRSYAESCSQCHTDARGAHQHVHGPVAAGACGACHQPHSAPHKGLLVLEGRELCLRCHVTTGMEIDSMHVVHEPVEGDCRVCHDPHATDVAAMLPEEPEALCLGCHADIADMIGNATTQHAAVTSEQSCLNCHAPHASNHERMLRNEPVDLCLKCHDKPIEAPDGTKLVDMKQLIESGGTLHGPVAQGNCTACHDIHGGGRDRLLAGEYPSALYYPFSGNAYALCFSCHDQDLVLVEESDVVTGFRNGAQNLHFVHVNKDERGRSCRVCHNSHASKNDHFIRDSIPYGPAGWELPIGYAGTATGGSCQSGCHQPFAYDRVAPVTNEIPEGDESWRGKGLIPEPGTGKDKDENKDKD
ncbi:MAG: hypothetical protein H6810_00950 [Phycisphaeraceae bacterium]|nr:MAG: hypothetical protein H6810_00950 [Phycisphaeraceae bacterium]